MRYDGIIFKPPIDKILAHSGVKGMSWKKHKYLKKEGGEYVYSGSGGASYSKYSEGDSDFDETNYAESNRIGNTDFFGFTNKQGKFVVITKDSKWVMGKGGKVTPEMIKRLSAFNKDGKLKGDAWQKAATEAITGQSSANKESALDILNRQKTRSLMQLTRGGSSSSSSSKSSSSNESKSEESNNKESSNTGTFEISKNPEDNKAVELTNKNKIGSSGFWKGTNKDGRIVIADQDDNTWLLPKGVEINNAMIKAIENFDRTAYKDWKTAFLNVIQASSSIKDEETKDDQKSYGAKNVLKIFYRK